MAIRNGFEKATTTIIDANVTTLISAVVLYVMGTDQVKGFAVTLILGIVMNLYTAIFVSRVFFDIAEKMRFITDLKMLHILSNPNFDFIGKRRIAIAASLIIIAVGMVAVVDRGKGLLDIDFTGGVSVQALFDKPVDIAQVRDDIDNVREDLPDATVQDVRIADETPGKRFVINTSNPNIDDVEAKLGEIFKGQLVVNHIEVAKLDAIPPAADATSAEKSAAPADGAATRAAEAAPPEATPPARTEPAKEEAPPGAGDGAMQRGTHRRGDELLLAMADLKVDDAAEPTAATAEPAKSEVATETPAAEPAKEDATAATIADEPEAAAEQPAEPAAPSLTQPTKPEAEAPAKTTGPEMPTGPNPTQGLPALPAEGATPAITVDSTTMSARFAGGSEVDITCSIPISHDRLLDLLDKAASNKDGVKNAIFALDTAGYEPGSDASFEQWHVRTTLPADAARTLLANVNDELSRQPYFPASSNIGAAVASATQQQAAVAMFASLVLILAYIWFRFSQVMFGVAGIIAVVHDVLVTLGALALSTWLARIPGLEFLLIEPFKISLPTIAAFLTIIGYSLNDTIVIFDRIREMRGKSPAISVELANTAINQTLSRTILTSLTVFIVVLILYAVGGEGIHGFAFALVVGVVAGTYSTIYIATPIVLWMNREELSHSKPALAESGVAQRTSQAS